MKIVPKLEMTYEEELACLSATKILRYCWENGLHTNLELKEAIRVIEEVVDGAEVDYNEMYGPTDEVADEDEDFK